MAYVPGCTADVFISYAHRDNEDGWVTRLKKELTEKLNPFLAGRAEVWFDDRIRPGAYFKEDIQKKLKNTPIFVAVVSPSYLYSDFCIVDELGWFQDQGGREVIQLIKVPLEKGQEVPLAEAHYMQLYDDNDGHTLTGRRLDKPLDEIVGIRPKVYVAQLRDETLKPSWDALKEELHAEGYATLPKGVLPARVPDGRIRKPLEDARLSLHLSGARDDPLAQRQLEVARQIGKPIIILPDPPRADGLPSVLGEVQRKLEALREPAVYFICDRYSDGRRISDLYEKVSLRTGCKVLLPEAGETYHKFRLRVSDGILLFRNEAPEGWFRSQEQVLLQAAALRGNRSVPEAWYFTTRANGGPVDVHIRQGPRHEWVIERTGEPNVDDLQPFFNALKSRVKAAGGQSG
jgi:hypothetical protein